MIKQFEHKRKVDWRNRLSLYLVDRAGVPFNWTNNDCAKFVANAVEAMTGHDPMYGLRGYRTEKGAKEMLKKAGVKSHIEILEKLFEETKPQLAVPGDIAVMEDDALGIVQGQYVYRPGGVLSDARDIRRAFRVPE